MTESEGGSLPTPDIRWLPSQPNQRPGSGTVYAMRDPRRPGLVVYVGKARRKLELRCNKRLGSINHSKAPRRMKARISQLLREGVNPEFLELERVTTIYHRPGRDLLYGADPVWIAHFWRHGHPRLNTH